MSTLPASPELKKLWIRVLKRVHPDLTAEQQDRQRSDWLTQQANDAYDRRDEVALRALLEPKGPLPEPRGAMAQAQRATPTLSTPQTPLVSQQPLSVKTRQPFGVIWAACAVLCLLLSVIFDTLSEAVGQKTSLSLLALLSATLVWLIARSSWLSYKQKVRSVAAVASGMILIGICVLSSRPRGNSLFPTARAATAHASYNGAHNFDAMNAHPKQMNPPQIKSTIMPPTPQPVGRLGSQLGGYIEAAKNKVAQKWSASEVAATTPAGATVYIQFSIRRRGNHAVPAMETSSGYSSLDVSCLRAVERVQTFDPFPKGYNGDSLTVLYHCTYPGSSTTKFSQDSILPPTQQPLSDRVQQSMHANEVAN